MNINQSIHEIQSCKHGKKSFSIASLQVDPNKLRSTKILKNHNIQVNRGDSLSRMSYYDREEQQEQMHKLKKENNSLRVEAKQLKSYRVSKQKQSYAFRRETKVVNFKKIWKINKLQQFNNYHVLNGSTQLKQSYQFFIIIIQNYQLQNIGKQKIQKSICNNYRVKKLCKHKKFTFKQKIIVHSSSFQPLAILQLYYYQKELENLQAQCKESETISFPLQQQVKIKQLMKCLSQKEIEIDSLKKQLKLDQKNDQQEQLQKLKALCEVQKSKLLSSETEILMPSKATLLRGLEEDNIKLVQIVQELEDKLKQTDSIKKHNTILQSKILNQQRLIIQLQTELRQYKERDNLFANKANQQNKTENAIQKLTQEIAQLSQQCQNQQSKIDEMIEIHKKDQDKYEKIIMEKEEEILNIKIKYENLNKSLNEDYSEQRFRKSSRNTPIFKPSSFSIINGKPLNSDFNLSSQRSQSARNRTKQIIVTKQDLQQITKILKYQILLNQISLQNIDQYLFKESSENDVKLQDLIEQFQNSIFKLTSQQAHQLSLYLIDAEDGTEIQSKQRIRSIFKTLVDNYQAPGQEDIDKYKKEIQLLFRGQESQNIKIDLIQRYGHQIQKIQIYVLFEILQQRDLRITKQSKDFLEAWLFQVNKFQPGVFQVDQLDCLQNIC